MRPVRVRTAYDADPIRRERPRRAIADELSARRVAFTLWVMAVVGAVCWLGAHFLAAVAGHHGSLP